MTRSAIAIALDVRNTLSRPLSELRGFAHPDGRPMTPRQAHEALRAELANGRELLPIGRTDRFSITPAAPTPPQAPSPKEKV